MYHESNGEAWHCPVRALTRRHIHLRENGADTKTFLSAYYDDKGLHRDFTCLLYSKLLNCLPEARVIEIINSMVNIEMEFVIDVLPVELIGMNSSMMCNYIKFCANQLLIALGYQRHYKIGNPFEWMKMISLQGKLL